MKITVDIPEVIPLESYSQMTFLVGTSKDLVTIRGDSLIEIQGNGGGGSSFTINVCDVLSALRDSIKLNVKQENTKEEG